MLSKNQEKKNAILSFEFLEENIDPKNPLFKITILSQSIEVNLTKKKNYNIEFYDYSNNAYKVYNCQFFFLNTKKDYSISVYFGKKNYYYCGIELADDSIEAIFSDFLSKKIDKNDCYIIYKNKKYFPVEDFGLKTRKRINLININIKEIVFPKLLMENESINAQELNERHYLFSISVTNKTQKLIGIYLNNPFNYQPSIDIKECKIILNDNIKQGNNFLQYKEECGNLKEYLDGVNTQLINKYDELLRKSIDTEFIIAPFFKYYRDNYDNEELQLINLYSEFLLMFPSMKNYPKIGRCVNKFAYYKQYYYSKKSINNFMKTIKENISIKDKILLKYCACRCLNSLLYDGYGKNSEKLFTFLDFEKKDTIYYDAIQHNLKFIDSLKETSEIFLFLLQLNSGSSTNKINSILSSRMTMLSVDDIKKELKKTIQKYGIRYSSVAGFRAITFNEIRMTCFCESSIFNHYCENIMSEIDYNYSYRFVLSNVLKHEDIAHLNFSLNNSSFQQDKRINPKVKNNDKYINSSPLEYYKTFKIDGEESENSNETRISIVVNDTNGEEKGESGESLMFFLTRGDKRLMNLLEDTNYDYTELFNNPSLMTEDDLSNFIEKLKAILPEENYDIIIYKKGSKYEVNKKKGVRVYPFPREPKI